MHYLIINSYRILSNHTVVTVFMLFMFLQRSETTVPSSLFNLPKERTLVSEILGTLSSEDGDANVYGSEKGISNLNCTSFCGSLGFCLHCLKLSEKNTIKNSYLNVKHLLRICCHVLVVPRTLQIVFSCSFSSDNYVQVIILIHIPTYSYCSYYCSFIWSLVSPSSLLKVPIAGTQTYSQLQQRG